MNKTNGTVLSILTTKKFNKNDIATSISSSGWLNITILNSFIDSIGIKNSTLIYPIKKVNSAQTQNSAQLSFLLNKKADDISVITKPTEIQILISI